MSKENKSDMSAVPISYNLQLATIVTCFFAGFVELVSILNMHLKMSGAPSSDFLLYSLSFTLFPLLLLVTAYLLSPGYRNVVSRTFVALVKAVLFMAVYGAVSVIYRTIQSSLALPNFSSGEPSFWYSPNIEYAFMAAVLASLIVTHYIKGPIKK